MPACLGLTCSALPTNAPKRDARRVFVIGPLSSPHYSMSKVLGPHVPWLSLHPPRLLINNK
jgi:hypothetical protein